MISFNIYKEDRHKKGRLRPPKLLNLLTHLLWIIIKRFLNNYMKNNRTFVDFDLRFKAHPVTGDVPTVTDEQAIKASVRNLVLTNFYERKFHPEIGSQVSSLLFEPYSMMLDIMIKTAISETIINYEPRVKLSDVTVNSSPDNNLIYISIQFVIINTTAPILLNLELQRTR